MPPLAKPRQRPRPPRFWPPQSGWRGMSSAGVTTLSAFQGKAENIYSQRVFPPLTQAV